MVYERPVDDSGLFSVIGAEYWKRTGKLPYGTEFGHMGVYGPLLYALHIPANAVFPPDVVFDKEEMAVRWGPFPEFEMRGAQTVILLFDLLAALGLYLLGRRYGGADSGVLLALVYLLCPYVIGIGGAGGLQWTSHIVGIPFIIFALFFAGSPVLAGLLLAVAAGMLYYPVFLVPLWFGYYVRTTGWKDAVKFIAPIVVVGLVCLFLILGLTKPAGEYRDMSVLRAFLYDTVYQQQFNKHTYGSSPFSFWGQYPAVAGRGKALAGFGFLALAVIVGFVPRRMSLSRLVALTAAVLVAMQLPMSHGSGTYIGFYIGPFIVTLFGPVDYGDMPPGRLGDRMQEACFGGLPE